MTKVKSVASEWKIGTMQNIFVFSSSVFFL